MEIVENAINEVIQEKGVLKTKTFCCRRTGNFVSSSRYTISLKSFCCAKLNLLSPLC